MFQTFLGLPTHALVVHAAVVLVPLAALGLIAIVFIPRLRRSAVGWLVLLGLFVAVGAAFVAKESGEALAELIGEPQEHAEIGDLVPLIAGLMLVVGLVWFFLARRDDGRTGTSGTGTGRARSLAATITGFAAVFLAVSTLVIVTLAGHSGAEAVWGGRMKALTASGASASASPSPSSSGSASPSASDSPSASASASLSPSASPSGTASASRADSPAASATATSSGSVGANRYTMAQVKAHGTPADCWAVINGNVYNLTAWENEHPGGALPIIGICGTDGTAAFDGQHSEQTRPKDELKSLQIGVLVQ